MLQIYSPNVTVQAGKDIRGETSKLKKFNDIVELAVIREIIKMFAKNGLRINKRVLQINKPAMSKM